MCICEHRYVYILHPTTNNYHTEESFTSYEKERHSEYKEYIRPWTAYNPLIKSSTIYTGERLLILLLISFKILIGVTFSITLPIKSVSS